MKIKMKINAQMTIKSHMKKSKIPIETSSAI